MAHCNPSSGLAVPCPHVCYPERMYPAMQRSLHEYPLGRDHARASGTWTSCASISPTIIALSSRIAALESQLAKAATEKTGGNRIIDYVLQAQADGVNKDAGLRNPNKAASALRCRLVRTQEENRTLKVTLRLLLQLIARNSESSSCRKRHSDAPPLPHQVKIAKPAEPQAAQDLLIDFSLPSEPIIDLSENGSISSIQRREEEENEAIAYGVDDGEAHQQSHTSYDSVDLAHTPYVFRFGHEHNSSASETASNGERDLENDLETEEKNSELVLKSRDFAWTPKGTPLLLAGQAGSGQYEASQIGLEEVDYEIAIPSGNTSFSSASTIAAQSDDHNIYTNSSKPSCTKEAIWACAKIFPSSWERERAIHNHQQQTGSQDLRFPGLFRYGIRFAPSRHDRDVYRTVVICDLPSNLTMTTLLEQVRGGLVIEAKILNTQSITGKNTGWIAFRREAAAMAFEEHSKQHPIIFKGKQVLVTALATPTWPVPVMLQKAITHHNHTRCLEVHHFRRQISPTALRRDLRICGALAWDAIEHMKIRADGVLELRFSSVRYAGQAFGILSCFREYRDCVACFVSDPCAQPLQAPVSDRPPGLDKCLEQSPKLGQEPELEPPAIDQSGRLEPVQCDGDAYHEACTLVRGRGFHTLDRGPLQS